MASERQAAAFFDLDRTLIAGSSLFEFGRAAYRAGFFSRRQLMRDIWGNLRFRMRGSTDQETEAVKDRIGQMIAGVRVLDLARLTPDILTGILPRVYPRMLKVAYAHQDAGRPIYICTAASQEISDLLANVLSFDGAIATQAEIVDGYYTGRYSGPFTYRQGKADAMEQFATTEGIDLSASYAYSDSESDLPMLELVGHPVVVNSDAALTKIARERGWEIMRFEKLAQRIKLAGVIGMAGAVSGLGTVLLTRRGRGRRLRPAELQHLVAGLKQVRGQTPKRLLRR